MRNLRESTRSFVESNSKGERLVCKLHKGLYGLKQSGRLWNNTLHKFLLSLGFTSSLSDNCVYTKNVDGSQIILLVWVDDLIIAAQNLDLLNSIKNALSSKYKMKDLGKLHWFLGINFECNDKMIRMSQSKYIEKVLAKFNMSNCTPKAIPCDPGMNKCLNDDSKELENPSLYREMVGCLIYIMTGTRPDICYAVTRLSQKLSKPTHADLNMCKYTLKYLKGTSKCGLEYVKTENTNLVGFSDSDWGGTPDRRSISGYCFCLGNDGTLISWKCRKQPTVALSTCESEFIGITSSIQESYHLKQLLSDMQNDSVEPVTIYGDNQGALELTKNPVHHQRTKHIDIRYFYIRSQIDFKNLILKHISTHENVADMFTKPVTKAKLKKFNICK